MNFYEIDWRIGPLHDVIVGMNAAIAAIRGHLKTEPAFDADWACEHVEALCGLGFVAAQTYALGTVSDLNNVRTYRGKPEEKKWHCYACDTITLKGGVTRIQLINASANYFKHHDEWAGWPTGHDTRTLASVGITEKTEYPCIDAIDLLCGTDWEVSVLHQIVEEWRAHLFRTLL